MAPLGTMPCWKKPKTSKDTPPCDTRPYRGRAPTAYLGCMTVALAAPIDRVYSSRPSHRQDLWVQREIYVFDGPLTPLIAGSRPRPWKRPVLRWPSGQNCSRNHSWQDLKGARCPGALAALMERSPRCLWPHPAHPVHRRRFPAILAGLPLRAGET